MFEKVGQMAEQLATNVSRRQFLGRFGGVALATAAAVGGILALPAGAHAGPPPRRCGPGSGGSCSGLNVGDSCFEEFTGTCSDRPRRDGACYCDFKGRRPR